MSLAAGARAGLEIERLLGEAESLPDPRARALAKALAAAMIDLVGQGLERIVAGDAVLERRMADDALVGNLMVLCGMHPDAAGVRARAALAGDDAVAELARAGVRVDEVEIVDGDDIGVRVRLVAVREPVRAMPEADVAKLRAMVEAVVVARAPDVAVVVVELGGELVHDPGFVPVGRLRVLP